MRWAVTADQMRRVDELAVGKYGILLEEMMELAGFHLASLARRTLSGSLLNTSVVLLAGKGNNGGSGLGAVRHLSNWGAQATVILSQKEGLNETVSARLKTLEALGVNIIYFVPKMKLFRMFNESELVIDALLGYSLKDDPTYPVSEIIDQANAVKTPVLSLDLPSGLDATTGKNYNPCITAEKTLTLALPKKGLLIREARDYVGDLYLADIGIPPILYREIGIEIDNIFKNKPLIRIY